MPARDDAERGRGTVPGLYTQSSRRPAGPLPERSGPPMWAARRRVVGRRAGGRGHLVGPARSAPAPGVVASAPRHLTPSRAPTPAARTEAPRQCRGWSRPTEASGASQCRHASPTRRFGLRNDAARWPPPAGAADPQRRQARRGTRCGSQREQGGSGSETACDLSGRRSPSAGRKPVWRCRRAIRDAAWRRRARAAGRPRRMPQGAATPAPFSRKPSCRRRAHAVACARDRDTHSTTRHTAGHVNGQVCTKGQAPLAWCWSASNRRPRLGFRGYRYAGPRSSSDRRARAGPARSCNATRSTEPQRTRFSNKNSDSACV